MPSVTIFSTACDTAILFRHRALSGVPSSGLHGPANSTVKVMLYPTTTTAMATMHARNTVLGLMRQ